jgi:hypothetical protein
MGLSKSEKFNKPIGFKASCASRVVDVCRVLSPDADSDAIAVIIAPMNNWYPSTKSPSTQLHVFRTLAYSSKIRAGPPIVKMLLFGNILKLSLYIQGDITPVAV